ncbi:MAG: hypothetical protein ACFFD5_09025 [Candidatus Thorarchaeota archaeon]
MKLRLILKTKTKKNKENFIKFNLAPSKHIGFINFVNLALKQGSSVKISFEKINENGEKEDINVSGTFNFESKP